MNEKKIAIIDYGMGNLGSISNMLKHLGYQSLITSDIAEIKSSDFLILPGVGKFDRAMKNIRDLDLEEALKRKVKEDKIPILGICLGMQIMCKSSEEGIESGLGLIDYEVKKFNFENSDLKVPHMGWNYVQMDEDNILHKNLPENTRFYFVHSYYVEENKPAFKIFTTHYGLDFVSGFASKNLFGVQFHPEKSHKYGKALFTNFLNYYE